jgi:hypothetical protein
LSNTVAGWMNDFLSNFFFSLLRDTTAPEPIATTDRCVRTARPRVVKSRDAEGTCERKPTLPLQPGRSTSFTYLRKHIPFLFFFLCSPPVHRAQSPLFARTHGFPASEKTATRPYRDHGAPEGTPPGVLLTTTPVMPSTRCQPPSRTRTRACFRESSREEGIGMTSVDRRSLIVRAWRPDG